MLKIKNQIRLLYINTALNAFQIAGASWVALLAARGFSLVEIGFAESVFHVASLLFEVPSGVISDVFGRKRSMALSQCMTILSALLMLVSDSLAGVLPAMIFSALGYNFSSGTREALAYESLKAEGKEARYDTYASTDMMIYTLFNSLGTLCAGLALWLGYRRAYLVDMILGALCLLLVFRLKEARPPEEMCAGQVGEELGRCLQESLYFLTHNAKALQLIALNAAVGAVATLLRFFLQAKLPENGLPTAALGPALFCMGLGGAAGAKVILLFRSWSYRRVCLLSGLGVIMCVLLALPGMLTFMLFCGFCAAFFDNFLQVRSDVKLNGMVPAGQRATLISVSSLCFSCVMIVLSPLFGQIFSFL